MNEIDEKFNELSRFSRYSTVMFSTGPMFLTHQATSYDNRSSIGVISQELYGKYVFNESQALFQHLKGKKDMGEKESIQNRVSFSFILARK